MLQNRLFFPLASRSGFGATISDAVARSSIVFCNSLCRSYCNGCVKVASCCGCICNTIVFCSWISEIILEWLHEGCEIILLADFLHFGTRVFLLHVGLEQCEVWGVKSAVWSVKEAVGSEKCGVWSVKCGVWSLSLECEARSVKCEVWDLECEGSSGKWEVWSVDCEVWSVKCGVWSFKFGVRRVQCEVWSVKTLLRLSLKKSNGCRGKDTVGTGCLWTIGHLCLGNFRRRLARSMLSYLFIDVH